MIDLGRWRALSDDFTDLRRNAQMSNGPRTHTVVP
jgi:hypothetical protein